jgi:hypothetical protein
MGKPASNAECQKQVRLIDRYEKTKEDLSVKTRENNKALATAIGKLKAMNLGEDDDLYNTDDGKGE